MLVKRQKRHSPTLPDRPPVKPLANYFAIKPQKVNTIAIVEWNWMGHHSTYVRLFTRALLEIGKRVIVMCPDPDSFMNELNEDGFSQEDLVQLDVVRISPPIDYYSFVPRRSRALLNQVKHFRRINGRLKHWEKMNRTSVDLVFFSCIYDYEFRYFHLAWKFRPRPWSGLYLHCRAFRKPNTVVPQTGILPCPERFLKASRLHSLAILDEGVPDDVTCLSQRPTIVFPDLVDESEPTLTVLSQRLRLLAGERPIVSTLGNLQYTKGSSDLAEIALDDSFSDHFFAFIGDVFWESFTSIQTNNLRKMSTSRENAYACFEHVGTEAEFNAAIVESDVIYAAYRDFPNSSNLLSKAAVFQIPIVVSDGHLMADRVREFRLGEVIEEGNIEAAKQAIRRITHNKSAWITSAKPRWQEFRNLHSYATLKSQFKCLIEGAKEATE